MPMMGDKSSIACSVKGRVRKKNARIYNDDAESGYSPTAKRSPAASPSPSKMRSPVGRSAAGVTKARSTPEPSPTRRHASLRTHSRLSPRKVDAASVRSPGKASKLKPLSTRVPAIASVLGDASEDSSETEDYDMSTEDEEVGLPVISPTKPITASDIPRIKLGNNAASTALPVTTTIVGANQKISTPPKARKELLFPDDAATSGSSSRVTIASGMIRRITSPQHQHMPTLGLVNNMPQISTTSHPSELAATRISFGESSPRSRQQQKYKGKRSSPRKHGTSPNSSSNGLMYEASKKETAQQIGIRLRNLLKLPKAHRWVCYEWFYSTLDECLLCGQNDFVTCMKTSFTTLKADKLMAPQWSYIRRLLGKPRRCSPAFFAEERAHLESKRSRIRCLQQRKSSEIPNLSDLPEEIPLQLVLGTKVTARLRTPRDGLYSGIIGAVDTQNHTYRIIFERADLGTHSIPDTEVRSKYQANTIAVSSFIQKPRKPAAGGLAPFMGGESATSATCMATLRHRLLQGDDSGNYGGYPIIYLKMITRLSKALTVKREWINRLKSINTDIEKLRAFSNQVPFEMQRRYAYIVLGMEKLNTDLNDYLKTVQEFTKTLAPDADMLHTVDPQALRISTEEEARDMLRQHAAHIPSTERLKDASSQNLIIKLTGMLLQIQRFNTQAADPTTFDLSALLVSIDECKAKLEPENTAVFKNEAEVHLDFIHTSLTQMGKLRLFDSKAPAYGGSDFSKMLSANTSDSDDMLD